MATTGMATEGSSVAFCGDGGQEAAEQALAANQCEELIVMEQKIFACLMAQPWEDAKEVCEKLCGRLVIAKSENKRLALHGFLHENLVEPETDPDKEHQSEYPTASVWVGASNKEDPWTPFYWVDATEMPSMKGMDGWGKNDPNVNDFAGVVLAIFGPGQYDDGIWFDREGVLSYIFVCESEDAPTG
ncbi:MAG TPA: C-type lectin domain-containing protein [Nannocystis exedens]|nr:C-type lectin domain-containing protein [Nannocystis exedens]